MTYPETISYLESFIDYEKIPTYHYKESLKLGRVRDFLLSIGNPQEALRCIHVAGSKGKGSTCAFITYILREAGYRVGLYTSPHLLDFRERIRILNPSPPIREAQQDFEGMITRQELVGLVRKLEPAVEKFKRKSKYGALSFFEVYTALAFTYFKEKKVDFVVLETGLGGRLDATNTAPAFISVITPISLEHTQKLGRTLKEIAAEKAGIIKSPDAIVISASQKRKAREVIRARARETGAKLYEVGKDIKYRRLNGAFNVRGIFSSYNNLTINLKGKHQLMNASAAIGAVEALKKFGEAIDAQAISGGLAKAVWPGRCEVAAKNPWVILDGAQNSASAKVLKEAIRENFKYGKLVLIFGVSSDKDIKGICGNLSGLADEVVLTKSNNPRAVLPEVLAGYFKGKNKHITPNTRKALSLAAKLSGEEDLILICGSLFVVGEIKGHLKKAKSKWRN